MNLTLESYRNLFYYDRFDNYLPINDSFATTASTLPEFNFYQFKINILKTIEMIKSELEGKAVARYTYTGLLFPMPIGIGCMPCV